MLRVWDPNGLLFLKCKLIWRNIFVCLSQDFQGLHLHWSMLIVCWFMLKLCSSKKNRVWIRLTIQMNNQPFISSIWNKPVWGGNFILLTGEGFIWQVVMLYWWVVIDLVSLQSEIIRKRNDYLTGTSCMKSKLWRSTQVFTWLILLHTACLFWINECAADMNYECGMIGQPAMPIYKLCFY